MKNVGLERSWRSVGFFSGSTGCFFINGRRARIFFHNFDHGLWAGFWGTEHTVCTTMYQDGEIQFYNTTGTVKYSFTVRPRQRKLGKKVYSKSHRAKSKNNQLQLLSKREATQTTFFLYQEKRKQNQTIIRPDICLNG